MTTTTAWHPAGLTASWKELRKHLDLATWKWKSNTNPTPLADTDWTFRRVASCSPPSRPIAWLKINVGYLVPNLHQSKWSNPPVPTARRSLAAARYDPTAGKEDGISEWLPSLSNDWWGRSNLPPADSWQHPMRASTSVPWGLDLETRPFCSATAETR
jgi:hypothetical protein